MTSPDYTSNSMLSMIKKIFESTTNENLILALDLVWAFHFSKLQYDNNTKNQNTAILNPFIQYYCLRCIP